MTGPFQHNATRTALILYGSETGNAQDIAEEVARTTERLRFNTTVLDLDSVSLRDLVKPTLVIFVVSTTGQGEFPQNARLFWRRLLSGALKAGVTLRKVRFASFGLGDSSYAQFNVAHRMLHSRMVQLGAKVICERGEGNEQHSEGHSAGFRAWVVALRERLMEVFPSDEGALPIAEDAFLEPKWKLEFVRERQGEVKADDGVCPKGTAVLPSSIPHKATNGTTPSVTAVGVNDAPSEDLVPVIGAYTATLLNNKRVTAPDHFQDVRLLDLRVDGPYEYFPGAVAVLYPKNFPQDVQAFIDLMAWQDIADEPLTFTPTTSSQASNTPPSPSPLRHLDLSHTHLTLRYLLSNVLDIMSIPRRSFFANLLHFATSQHPDALYQKARLLELANPDLIDELWDYTTRPKRTILEAFQDFTTLRIPYQYALTTLPLIKGRQFSIASGGSQKQDSQGRTKVELLVAIANPPSPIIKYRRRHGVCTRYIASLQPCRLISIGLQPGYLDVSPAELSTPVLMIGPGTGVAPMRAMIYQRLAWATEMGCRPAGKRLEGDVLVFGCRSSTADCYFADEWRALCEGEGLTVLTAFSREAGREKMYVQDVLRRAGERVSESVVGRKGRVYVCGSSGAMPKGVREALVDVLVECGEGMEREGAERYVEGMERCGRWKQETW
ncbi:NAPDH-dependent diflavin reductase [Friedmanniomyces endolithicus]|nr:NAPDH-dependent diflavin reductase [Friedmanniomyces endolithicus]KAK0823906.1 NAPDH-dependent diflavin reductase [Friedmanniomyces endolithicus]